MTSAGRSRRRSRSCLPAPTSSSADPKESKTLTNRILAHRHRLITDENSRWWTLGAMCFALFMVMLDNTVVDVSLPSIQRGLHASLSALEWTINAYTLTFAVL